MTCAIVLIGLLVSFPDATATTVTARLGPAADAYVSETRPTANFGSERELLSSGAPKVRRSYLRFELPNLGGTVAKATVRLHSKDGSDTGFAVHAVTGSSWAERTITYTNAPPPGLVVATVPQVSAGAVASVDVTRLVAGAGVVNLAVTATGRLRLASRESGGLAPELVMELVAAGSSTATSTTLAPASPSLSSTSTTLARSTASQTSTSTTRAQTTTTLGPTTTEAGPSTPGGAGQALASLTWAPPVLNNPVTYRVSGTPAAITAAPGQDSIVRFVGPVNRRLVLEGGRNWVIVGGEINIDRPWEEKDRNAIHVKGATGVVHIEGVYMHGAYINEGIKACARDAVFQLENNRIVDLRGTQAGYHADVIQPYCGFKELRVDGLTGYSQFQGLMFKADEGSWRTTILRRVNLVGIAPQDGYPINVVTGCCNDDGNSYVTGPISLSDVYVSPDVSHHDGTLSGNVCPADSFTFATDPATGREYAEHKTGLSPPITGRIWEGRPDGGDYVPAGVAGVGYVAPPYLQ